MKKRLTDKHAQPPLFAETKVSKDPARCCVVCGNFGPSMFVRGFCEVLRKSVYDDEVCPNFRGHREQGAR